MGRGNFMVVKGISNIDNLIKHYRDLAYQKYPNVLTEIEKKFLDYDKDYFINLIEEKKKNLLEEKISASRLNTFINSIATFILRYIFNYATTNYRMIAGKTMEKYIENIMWGKMLKINEIFDLIVYQSISNDEIILDEEDPKNEIKDLEKCAQTNAGLFLQLRQDYELKEYQFFKENTQFVIYTDMILTKKENGENVLFELKYTKQKKTENNFNYGHLRQIKIYKSILQEINNAKLLYLYPSGYSMIDVSGVEKDETYLDRIYNQYIKFIKNLDIDTILFYLENDIDSYYKNVVEKYICLSIFKKIF